MVKKVEEKDNQNTDFIIDVDKANLDVQWKELINKLSKSFGKNVDLNAILFLIGIQELGKGKKFYSKEEKQDLMHIAICKVLSLSGYYELIGTDKEGWPHWQPTKKLPFLKINSQEEVLRIHIIEYFNSELGW